MLGRSVLPSRGSLSEWRRRCSVLSWLWSNSSQARVAVAPGRAAEVLVGSDKTPAGRIGELHPEVLAAWSIQMPCAACELELEALAAASA